MNVIVFLDQENGMLFHNRRQSRDREATARVQQLCRGKTLWMNPYSAQLYGEMESVEISVSEQFLLQAGTGTFCLVESDTLTPFEPDIESVIVFRWDKKYPADFCFDIDLHSWEKVETQEFSGHSHEIITEEIYRKRCK